MNQTSTSPSMRHSWYALWVLFVVGLFTYLDRAILAILQIPVKAELGLSDSQLGLLTGLAFAFFFAIVGLPVARLADRTVRKHVLAVSIVIWMLATAACGLAMNFVTLLFLRIGLAVGEAGAAAPVHSMISDYFPREKRATAMAIWSTSIALGVMLAFLVGGYLSAEIGWRNTFFVVGLSGLILAPIVMFTLKEPPRGRFDGFAAGADRTATAPLRLTIRTLWGMTSYRNAILAAGFAGYASSAMMTWNAPFYSRVHNVAIGDIALTLAFLKGVGGVVGVLIGGYLVQYLGRRDTRWFMFVPAIASLGMIPFAFGQYFVESLSVSIALAVLPAIGSNIYLAPVVTVVQSVAPANMRAFSSAGLALASSLIGLGLGPTMVGFVSDYLIEVHGMTETSLRWAISVQMIGALIAAALFYRGAARLPQEMGSLAGETRS